MNTPPKLIIDPYDHNYRALEVDVPGTGPRLLCGLTRGEASQVQRWLDNGMKGRCGVHGVHTPVLEGLS